MGVRRSVDLRSAPIVPSLLRLAAPNAVTIVATMVLVTVDAVFVGRLSPAAFAGISLVFPIFMLMQTVAAGGFGSAIASTVARAIGRGSEAEARAFAAHAFVVGLTIAALFTLLLEVSDDRSMAS